MYTFRTYDLIYIYEVPTTWERLVVHILHISSHLILQSQELNITINP